MRILEEIGRMGYTGSVIVLRRYVRSLRPRRERAAKLTVRYETPPGKQAHADWVSAKSFAMANGPALRAP